jgi:adenine-specific DNA-methyltransferase
MVLSSKEKFQQLLRELFQFDCADLDFGIYRIMNFKRDAIENFIQKDLIETVDRELSKGAVASQIQAAEDLKNIVKEVQLKFGDGALDSNNVLAEAFKNTPLGKDYNIIKSQATGTQTKTNLETEIYNHLYAFFSRYYDSGDFLSKRRYSRKEKYAIPYNGEEVYLHWANSDQYYIKTGEYFNNYQYKTALGVTVHFKLVVADVEKDNVKGDKRFFIPITSDMVFNAKDKEVIIPFHYRPLSEQENIKYGQRNQQASIITEALTTIPNGLKKFPDVLPALQNTHHTNNKDEPVSLLEHHLNQYTRRNTSDFFIHKDLKGFLTRELEFYLKNEVLNIDEIGIAGQARAEGWFQVMGVIKAIGERIIEFLAQIENFQKKLFEKKKFITETQYCVTMSNIPMAFYAENDRLLSSFNNLDSMTDGLNIKSENFQALSLLIGKYGEKIKCSHIDPPYNTQTSGFLYKNSYQHSSWLAMMENRMPH